MTALLAHQDPVKMERLARGNARRIAAAEHRKAIAAIADRAEAVEAAAQLIEQRPESASVLPVERLLRAIKGCGPSRAEHILAGAAEGLGQGYSIPPDKRLGELTDRQADALAFSVRITAELGWSA